MDPGITHAPALTSPMSLRQCDLSQQDLLGGRDGIRPQHIVPTLLAVKNFGSELLSAITAFTNSLLQGKCHHDVIPILFGGNLIALEKKSGGIRPIAIGYTWRRIAAKCANFYASAQIKEMFSPRQLGVAIPGGCEAAIHATRRFVESMPSGHAIVKLDIVNAFNSLHRDAMLVSVTASCPEIYRFCHLSYSKSSILKFGNRSVLSQEGPQQGDPLGPLLFCLTIHPVLSSLSSELAVGYLDDITLGGAESVLTSDVQQVITQGKELGLSLNVSKCEFISETGCSSEEIFKDFIHLQAPNSTLLGAPLTTGAAMDAALESRCADLSRATERLKLLSAHDSLILLRSSLSAPKLIHILRCSPCTDHSALATFDKLLHSGINAITNSNLSETQWIQASLPVKDGGLGIRRAASLASSAFLASAVSTRVLQDLMLNRCSASI